MSIPISEPRVEAEGLRLLDVQLGKLWMSRIKQIVSFLGHNHTGNGQGNAGVSRQPGITDAPRASAHCPRPPILGEIFGAQLEHKRLRDGELERDVIPLEASPVRMDKRFQRGEG